MKISILGTGYVGATLGKRLADFGHTVVMGSRHPESSKVQQLVAESTDNLTAADIPTAAAAGDIVVLAVPWQAAEQTLRLAGSLDGKIVVDCINPLNDQFTGLDLGFTTSAAERIAAWVPHAHVVKAFNTVSAATMADPAYGQHAATMFYCGDNEDAKARVHQLAVDLGFDPVDSGGLAMARYLEPLAMLYIHLAMDKGWGSHCAFKVLKR